MAAKTSWHRYGAKLRHCHPMYNRTCGVQVSNSSGVARNFRQGVRQSVTLLSVHSRSAAYQVGRTVKKRHDISYRLND